MLLGPLTRFSLLKKEGLSLSDLTLLDMHEAFSAWVLANVQLLESNQFAQEKLGLSKSIGTIDMDKFNVNGGSLAYGHPCSYGVSNGDIVLHELHRRGEEWR